MNSNIIDYKKRPRQKNKATLYSETQKTIRSLIITLTIMIAILGVVFLITSSQSSQKGYALKQEKLLNEHLRAENDSINSKINLSTSFTDLEESDKLKNMEEVKEKIYITDEDNKVQ